MATSLLPVGPPTALSALTVGGVPIQSDGTLPLTNGNYVFVSSVTGNSGYAGSIGSPLATVSAAITSAGANGIIVCLPGHAETISSATTLAISTAGIAVIGLGQGITRPTFTFSTANTATIAISAANVTWSNCIFAANFLSIAAAFTLSTARNFTLVNNLFLDTSSILDFLNIVKSTGAANTIDGIMASGNQWASLGTTSVNSFLLTANTIDRAILMQNAIVQATTVDAAILITATAGILTNLNCAYNKGYRNNTTTANGSLINVGGTTSTGFVNNNYVQTLTTSADALFTTSVGLSAFNNYVTGVKGASGFIIPAVDS